MMVPTCPWTHTSRDVETLSTPQTILARKTEDGYYLTVTGTSAEMGDDGFSRTWKPS